MSASTTTKNSDELPPLRFMTEAEKAADWERLLKKIQAKEQRASSDAPPPDLPAYEEELKGHERPDPEPTLGPSPSPNSKLRTPNSLYFKFSPIGGGRFHVTVERGALAHTDALRLASERQRLRFAQACDAKDPGCFADVLSLLEKEAVKQPFKTNPREDDGCRLLFTPASSFLPEAVDWVWENYLPAASVTILEGEPGVGKSLLLADLAARVSRGLPMPDRSPAFDEPGHDPNLEPGLVWWFSGHDHPEQTLSPRLSAARADLNMIRIAEGIEDPKSNSFRAISFPDDFLSLWKSRAQTPRLVIIDPLSAFTGGAHNHQAAAKALAQLALFARETSAAILIVHSSSRAPSARPSSDSSAPLAVARSALLLARHPDDPSRLVHASLKSNLCAPPCSQELSIQSLASPERQRGEAHINQFRASQERERLESLHQTPAATTESLSPLSQSLRPPRGRVRWGGDHDQPTTASPSAPTITWHGPSALTPSDLLRAPAAPARSPFETRQVEAWLSEKLSAGPALAKHIQDQATLDDIPPTLLRRARLSLNIIPSGRNGSTTWRLPTIPPPAAGEGRVGGPLQPAPVESQAAKFPSPALGEGLEVRASTDPSLSNPNSPAPAGPTLS